MRKILIDTNAFSAFIQGDEAVLEELSRADAVYVSIFVLGELYAGFKGGTREKQNRDIVKKFLLKPTVSVLNTTTETADIFAGIKHNLKKQGTPIPINDVWISAQVFETGSLLVTYDDHFTSVPGIRLWDRV